MSALWPIIRLTKCSNIPHIEWHCLCEDTAAIDIGSLDPDSNTLISLFHPRTQQWSDHFQLDGVHIIGLTAEGRTTVTFLQLNTVERLIERAAWIRVGRYPPG